jgi:hypothetical protein
LEESELSERQRKWLEASAKIGRGAMTKTERQSLERLYAEMLPAEQQELANYIQEKFGKKDEATAQSEPSNPAQETTDESTLEPQEEDDDPIAQMERKAWKEPSKALLSAFSKPQKPGK